MGKKRYTSPATIVVTVVQEGLMETASPGVRDPTTLTNLLRQKETMSSRRKVRNSRITAHGRTDVSTMQLCDTLLPDNINSS